MRFWTLMNAANTGWNRFRLTARQFKTVLGVVGLDDFICIKFRNRISIDKAT